jgi:hypothetical protein
MSKVHEKRKCSECPKTFLCSPDSRKKTCGKRCKKARKERVGEELETRVCPVCHVEFTVPETSSNVVCGRRTCVDTWARVCRKRADAKRAAAAPPKPPVTPSTIGPFGLERDPFVFSMSTGCPGFKSWLCPEMLPFDYQAGAVCVRGR